MFKVIALVLRGIKDIEPGSGQMGDSLNRLCRQQYKRCGKSSHRLAICSRSLVLHANLDSL
jgi:hypothetical protein